MGETGYALMRDQVIEMEDTIEALRHVVRYMLERGRFDPLEVEHVAEELGEVGLLCVVPSYLL